jgi:hypothetical protein
MLYSVSQIVATELALRGCPLRVVYGPERLQDVGLTDSRIVFQRPRSASDVTGPPKSSKGNPPRRAERAISGVVRIYGHSTADGARVQDHEDVAEQAVDLVIVTLQVAVARLVTTATIGTGGYLPAAELQLAGLEAWPGVVYELPITIQRAVFDRTWAGDAKSTTDTYSMTVSGTCVTTAVPE